MEDMEPEQFSLATLGSWWDWDTNLAKKSVTYTALAFKMSWDNGGLEPVGLPKQ